MIEMTVNDFLLTMAALMMLMGVITFGIGVYIIVAKVVAGDVRSLATQTAKLAQKGITDDVSGLVGNASTLIDSLNGLTKTSAGLGMFLIFVGLALFGAAYALITKINLP
jgi:F0F1-type ATP synthase membrane subunit c/vacuolar-type H+-ATPase subunit K